MPTASKPRINYIDFMKGLCILFIVISHTDDTIFALAGHNLNFTLESFRIPMYYFISGLFFKRYDGFSDFTRRKVNNIVVPMIFFYLVAFVFIWLGQYLPPAPHYYGAFEWSMLTDPLFHRVFTANAPLWFLLSLFEVNLIFYALQRFLPNRIWVGCTCMGLSIIGWYCGQHHVALPLVLDTAFIGLPYFVLGSEAKRHNALLPHRYDRWGWVALIVLLCSLYPFAQQINIFYQVFPNYLYLYLVPIISILTLLWACKRLPYIPVINYIGRYSIVVLCTHFPLIRPLHRMFKTVLLHHGIEHELLVSLLTLALILIMELVFIYCLTRVLPWLTAQKPLFEEGWRPAWHLPKVKPDGD